MLYAFEANHKNDNDSNNSNEIYILSKSGVARKTRRFGWSWWRRITYTKLNQIQYEQ